MKLKKLKDAPPKYEGKFWSYQQRKFLSYNELMTEDWPCGNDKKEKVKSK